jgi:hypothetical protein
LPEDDDAPPPAPEEPEGGKEEEPPRQLGGIPDPDWLAELTRLCQSGEYERLMRYAYYRMRGIRERVVDTDARDLLHEAIARTRIGDPIAPTRKGIRLWNPKEQTLFNHLLGCMRSIGNELAKKGGRFTASAEWAISPDDIHGQVEAKANLQRLRARLRGDILALEVLESILDGETPKETQARLRIPSWDYEKGRKRVIRKGRQLFGPKGNTP